MKKIESRKESGSIIAWFVVSLAVSAVLTALIAVPFIGMFAFLLTVPLHFVWPELGYTSALVEYGPFWITIKQSWLWPVFSAYFFVVAFSPGFLIVLLRLRLQVGHQKND